MKNHFYFLLAGLLIPFAAYPEGTAVQTAVKQVLEAGFTELERQVINQYYGHADPERDRAAAESKREEDSREGAGKKQHKHAHKKAKHDKKANKKTPPGLARRDSLPPGLARQYERNGKLPPGLESRVLPHRLHRNLPPREGLQRVIVDTDVLLVETATGIIRDILYDIVK